MKHCIIAKFNDSVDDKAAMITRIDKLFAPARRWTAYTAAPC